MWPMRLTAVLPIMLLKFDGGNSFIYRSYNLINCIPETRVICIELMKHVIRSDCKVTYTIVKE